MGCSCPDNSGKSLQYLACAQMKVHDAVARLYANADLSTEQGQLGIFAHRGGSNPSSMCYVLAVLASLRLPYWHKNPGDCGQQTKINLGVGVAAAKVAGFAGLGAGATAATAQLTGAAFAGTAVEAATIIGLAALPFTVWGIFSAHHAQAVAKEQATLCDVSVAYNQFSTMQEAALSTGQVDLKTASQRLDAAVKTLVGAMADIRKECNFACGTTYAVQALGIFNKERIYPLIEQAQFAPQATPLGSSPTSRGLSGELLKNPGAIVTSAALLAGKLGLVEG